jgi:hypothetical protein
MVTLVGPIQLSDSIIRAQIVRANSTEIFYHSWSDREGQFKLAILSFMVKLGGPIQLSDSTNHAYCKGLFNWASLHIILIRIARANWTF